MHRLIKYWKWKYISKCIFVIVFEYGTLASFQYKYHQILFGMAEESYEILSFDTLVYKNKHYCRWKEKIWFKDVWRWVNADWTESQRQALVYFWQVG